MSYPFVSSAFDLGPRSGPILGFVIHMAEGGGTVAYLHGNPARGVSVHYVIERSGRIVQMLAESHLHGSINPTDLRDGDDPSGPFGESSARAVLGSWFDNPNNATIAVEIEGFAAEGPNDDQVIALQALVADVRSRHPSIGLLGHRDFQDYKPCPGQRIPWALIGGHGREEETMPQAKITDETPKIVTANAGHTWRDLDGTTVLLKDRPALAARLSPYGVAGGLRAIFASIGELRRIVLIDPATVDDPPPPPAADRDAVLDEAAAAVTALKGS